MMSLLTNVVSTGVLAVISDVTFETAVDSIRKRAPSQEHKSSPATAVFLLSYSLGIIICIKEARLSDNVTASTLPFFRVQGCSDEVHTGTFQLQR